MTAKEKALELVNKYECGYSINGYHYNFFNDLQDAKQCALIAVDELINAFTELSIEESGRVHIDFGHGYWQEVKQEIHNL